MTMHRTLSLFVILLFAFSCATGQPASDPAAQRIDRFIRQAMTQFPEIPSMGVAVVRGGRTILTGGYGLRDRDRKLAADADTVYYIASSTKSYVGLLAALLDARGVVDLDRSITQYLPELRFGTGIDPQKVTLRALLTHTSGISNDAIVMRTAFSGEHTPSGLVELLGRSKAIEPKFQYDNLGYVAVGLALERATGKKWQDLLATELFAPLGMTHTTAYMSRTTSWPLAKPYDMNRDMQLYELPNLKNDMTMHAAGGLVTTPRDLARWLEANVNAGRVGGRQVLPAAVFAEAHKRQVDTPEREWYRFKRNAYGLGWYHADHEGTRMMHHFGGFEGWRAHVSFLPQQKHGVAATVNSSGPGTQLADLVAAYAYDVLLGKPDVDAAYVAHLAKLRSDTDERIARSRAEIAKRLERPPSLVRARDVYAGAYRSDLYGTLTIRPEGSGLRASIGQLAGVLEPFTEPDSARVELLPGSGEVLRFVFENGDRAAAVKFRDEVFRRVE